MKIENSVYLLPGRGGSLNGELGQVIISLGYNIYGREVREAFEMYPIGKQTEIICNDIKSSFWGKEFRLVAHSYGGYLMMHAMLEFLPEVYPGKILLLSPVLGISRNINGTGSRPPRAKRILESAEKGYLDQLDIEIHTGDKDIGCDYKLAEKICSHMKKTKLTIIKDAPHDIGKGYTIGVLKNFLMDK